ncbi:MAG: hypothetical protein U0572_06650 [Phycisphaerales bacterium]
MRHLAPTCVALVSVLATGPAIEVPRGLLNAAASSRADDDSPAAWSRIATSATSAERLALVDRDDVALFCAQSRCERSMPPHALDELRGHDDGGAFLDWLWNDRAALEDLFATGAPPTDMQACLEVLRRIWAFDRDCERGLESRLARAVALEHATPIVPWSEWGDREARPIDPVARYAFYRDAHRAGTLFPCFATLKTWELRRVVDIPLYDEDVAWFHAHLTTGKDGKDLRSQHEIGNAMWLIKYREVNERNGHNVQEGKPYYDGKRWTPAVILEYGGVCGAVSKFGTFAARAFGVPAQPLGQIGHCAMTWKAFDDRWITGNCGSDHDFAPSNLHGLWGEWTTRGAAIPLFVRLAGDANFGRSMRLAELTLRVSNANDEALRSQLIEAARTCPLNVTIWREVVDRYLADVHATRDEGLRIMVTLGESLAEYPQIALDLISRIDERPEAQLFDPEAQLAVLKAIASGASPDGRADRDIANALREVVGHGILRVSQSPHRVPQWPYREHLDVLNGTTSGISRLVRKLDNRGKAPIYDYAVRAIPMLVRYPSIGELLAERLATSAETDEAARSVALRAINAVIDNAIARGSRRRALELARAAILAGERMACAEWVRPLTAKALEIDASRRTDR